jgi:Tfp pilus assembly protein PilX
MAANRLRRQAQRGSAYLVALLALVVLTIIGLSLALITQTENQLGSNERTLNRVFYAADSGISFSTARALVNRDTTPQVYPLEEADNSNRLLQVTESVDTSAFYPILDAPCNLCEINDAGSYAQHAYRKTTYAVTATATRESSVGNTLMAQKTLSSMLDVQPQSESVEDYQPISNPAELARIKY